LGASRISIVRLVAGDALLVLIAGLAIGIPLAWGSVRIASRVLLDRHSPDAGPIVAAIALLLVTGTVAAAAPALRAMSLNPVDALRRH
jgi:putative ABC transport system permease protein